MAQNSQQKHRITFNEQWLQGKYNNLMALELFSFPRVSRLQEPRPVLEEA